MRSGTALLHLGDNFFSLHRDTDRCIKLICVLASELNVILYKAGNLGSEARWPKQLKLEF